MAHEENMPVPTTSFEKQKSDFKDYYTANAEVFADAAKSLHTLLALLLTDQDDFETPQVQSRVKDCIECIDKFERKYQADCEARGGDCQIKDHITDLIGLRIICLYEDDIPKIKRVLAANFAVLSETDKSQMIEGREDLFGYRGYHLDLELNSSRCDLPEYKRFKGLRFEVQLRTIVQDAWSNLDHKIKYKKNIPIDLRRRISRLAALFELADQEFQTVRTETEQFESRASDTGFDAPTSDDRAASRLDAFSLRFVMNGLFPGYPFIGHRIDAFVEELLRVSPEMTADGLRRAFREHEATVLDYRNRLMDRTAHSMNPYTIVRHVLYLQDRQRFARLLFDAQRASFDEWLADERV